MSGFQTIAVNTVTYLPYSLDEALQGIRAAGFRHVEIAAIPGVCEHIPLDMDDTATGTLKRKLDGLGLHLCSLSSHTDLTSKKGSGLAKQAIQLASRLKASIVNTAVGGPSNENEDEISFSKKHSRNCRLCPAKRRRVGSGDSWHLDRDWQEELGFNPKGQSPQREDKLRYGE